VLWWGPRAAPILFQLPISAIGRWVTLGFGRMMPAPPCGLMSARTEAEVERTVAGLAREHRAGLIVAADPDHRQHARSDFESGRTAPRPVDRPL
jgi:hypothetical protein